MSNTVASPTTASLPMMTVPVRIRPAVGPVTGERGVPTDDGAVTDRQQVGADRDLAREDRYPAADLRAECPQVQHIQRRSGEQDERVDLTSVATSQNRKWATPQSGNSSSFHRPTSSHLAAIGTRRRTARR
jgi:hypothetical protein